ncbi:acetyl-CoA carboxylase, carboxyltransferase subunit beta [Eubacteriaceae bacterium ES3]|nr:acetyl-CoA carboxylase, carboxyltransferase subunit beta [Eubacteriaceae bacterium ES3]
MINRSLFKKPKNELESSSRSGAKNDPTIPHQLCQKCPDCGTLNFTTDLDVNNYICSKCGYHFPFNARQRIELICDADSFSELFAQINSENTLDFPGYSDKLVKAQVTSHENEGVITGTALIENKKVALFIMEGNFMMGSMGQVVGEKITKLFEYATEEKLPVIGYTISGGARMQEGMLALMQMAKTSGGVKRHNDAGLLYIAVLTHPTTGGVTASFAMEGDIILAEPGALIAFAGPRVIEQTIRQRLPKGFQRAEFLQEKGFLDGIVPRFDQKSRLNLLLSLHSIQEVS